jgi:nitroimidazol reductase NimA-like FMN-containing flavoprotein (pyridoxamine 5'-phosphate oxidase superfamily)
MRRKDKERDTAFALEVLRDCKYVTIATINSDGTPYCIPISIALLNGFLYFHCALEGQKLDNIKRNSKVCVSGVRRLNHVPEHFTAEYESAVATGKCEIVTNDKEKFTAIKAICEKYAASNMDNFDESIKPDTLGNLGICKIKIERITGKSNGFER